MKALAFGEILWDIYSHKSVIGGAPFNFAAHFVKNGGEAYLLSSVGNDSLKCDTLKEIENKGVKTDYVVTNEKETGKCLVSLDENSVPTYNLLNDVAYDYIDISDVLKKKFDILYFGTLSLRGEWNFSQIKKLVSRGNFEEIFVDLNIRQPFSTEKAVIFGVETATVLKISDEELDFVTNILFGKELDYQKAAEKLAEKYPRIKFVIITLGNKGSYVYDSCNKKGFRNYGKRVEAVSSVGAGDSFSATFMYSYMTTRDIVFSLEMATRVSAFVVTNTEAIPDYDPEYIRIMPIESARPITDDSVT
ncbi:MAG: PfkB family carbohydrate kinase [Acutalibacteraceae bacterium]|nr:PfkB family carbohydrate kinase [Acutalibacteraceae bacterium]